MRPLGGRTVPASAALVPAVLGALGAAGVVGYFVASVWMTGSRPAIPPPRSRC
ncbi:hypothetical protein AB0G35_33460 [Streptomyces sp. NPDC021749]|uniref:hypothetical protein n=1 Tax=Streptomyces sp. NPDC021749 TaxID=3154905 RepID=UPI0033F6D96B